jgi:hypothetical protein
VIARLDPLECPELDDPVVPQPKSNAVARTRPATGTHCDTFINTSYPRIPGVKEYQNVYSECNYTSRCIAIRVNFIPCRTLLEREKHALRSTRQQLQRQIN